MIQTNKVITPWGAVRTQTSSRCKFFFPCTETGLTSDGYMTDVINGIKHKPALANSGTTITGGLIRNVTGLSSAVEPVNASIVATGVGAETDLFAGVWPTFSTSGTIVIQAVGRITDYTKIKTPIGDGTNANPDMSVSWNATEMHSLMRGPAASPQMAVNDTTNGKVLANGQDVSIVMIYSAAAYGNDFTVEAWDLTTGVRIGSGATEVYLAAGGAAAFAGNVFTPHPVTRINGIALYGWAGFQYAGAAPSNLKTMLMWNAYQWAHGHRFLCPGI